MEPIKPVENPVAAGTQAGVEAVGTTSAPVAPEVDLLEEFQKVVVTLEKTQEENKRISTERDNYKKGLLRYKKGNDPLDVDAPQFDEEEVERRAEERAHQILVARQREDNEKKAREIALQALKENRELKAALKSKTGTTTSPSVSSNAGGTQATETYWTPEQLAYFKTNKIDPAKVKENYLRSKS